MKTIRPSKETTRDAYVASGIMLVVALISIVLFGFFLWKHVFRFILLFLFLLSVFAGYAAYRIAIDLLSDVIVTEKGVSERSPFGRVLKEYDWEQLVFVGKIPVTISRAPLIIQDSVVCSTQEPQRKHKESIGYSIDNRESICIEANNESIEVFKPYFRSANTPMRTNRDESR